MKKIIIIVLVLILVIGAGVGAWYYFFKATKKYGDPRPPKDLTGIVVPPVAFPLKGKTFMVPGATSTTVTLDLVSPTAKRDYPMARFTAADGATTMSLVAQDDFVTPFEAGVRAVPISVSEAEMKRTHYLAILEGDAMTHIASLPIGEMIQIKSVTRTGNTVTVAYLVHDRAQQVTEEPTVATSAIFDIVARSVVQAGRTPATETFVETKSFVGEYLWVETVGADDTKTTPSKPDVFTLRFDANRINLGTDCNSGSATFVAESGSSTKFTLDEIAQTKMFCESAQEGVYFDMVKKITDYTESANGTLTFTLTDGGSMKFVPKGQVLEFASTSTPAQ